MSFNEINNKFNNDPKDLSYFFRAAAGQQVDFSQAEAKNLISKGADSYWAINWMNRLTYRFALKSIIVASTFIIGITGYFMLNNVEKNQIISQEKLLISSSNNNQTEKVTIPLNPNQSVPVKESNLIKSKPAIHAISEVNNEEFQNAKDQELADNKTVEATDDQEFIPTISQSFDVKSSNQDYINNLNIPYKTAFSHIPANPNKNTSTYWPKNHSIETLIGNLISKKTYWGAASAKFTALDNKFSVLAGSKVGLTVNNKISAGISYFELVNTPNMKEFNNVNMEKHGKTNMKYGNIFFEYTVNPDSPVRLIVSNSFGLGFYAVDSLGDKATRIFAIMEPGLTLETSISSFVRVGVEANYRLSSDFSGYLKEMNSNFYQILGNNFSKPLSLSLVVKFGIF
ncbi:MAG: hypothetical protein NT007_05810 [Candidatus Kapabacteria bacterium]|nr:hypothetical protein [Candidatus Kapabacteria bacterium]